MFEVILAMDKNGGIGFKGVLPWKITTELQHFKTVTEGHILLVGRKTRETLPALSNRTIWTLSESNFRDVDSVIKYIKFIRCQQRVFVAGGGQIYNEFFKNHLDVISKIHLSIVKGEYDCDTFVDLPPHLYVEKKVEFDDFTYYTLGQRHTDELQYLNLLSNTITDKPRFGRNGLVYSHFTSHLKFNLMNGFPLLTSKKMFFRGIIEELLFFIRGDTDSKKLEAKGVNIWKENTSREFLDNNHFTSREDGDMGPMYGYQWRFFNKPYDSNTDKKGLDQLNSVIDEIKRNPTSRRILLTDFNPLQVHEGVLYPCHSIIIQFYVEDGFLDMFCFNRSSDLFLGLPFNIASSALFLSIIANLTDLRPRFLNLSLGDCHIYAEHKVAVEEQLKRFIHAFPTLHITRKLSDIDDLRASDFEIQNYTHEPTIKAKMVA